MAGMQSSNSISEKELFKRYEDLLEIARLVSWRMNGDVTA